MILAMPAGHSQGNNTNGRKIKGNTACSHGGIYSTINPSLVRVDFSFSLNPLGLPDKAFELVQREARSLASIYPDSESRQLKAKLSKYLGVDPSLILVGNGSLEIIHWFARTFAKKHAVIPCPTFCEYELACSRSGAGISFVPLLKSFDIDADSIIRQARGSSAVFLCNPNNPTGVLSTKSIQKLIELIHSKMPETKILLDECFIELVDFPDENSMVNRIGEIDNLVIIRSLTKSFSMAGLRLGYSVCNKKLAREMAENKISWNVNGLAQAAGVAALEDMEYLERARSMIRTERNFMQKRIKASTESFAPCRSDANYFMIRVKGCSSTKARDLILKRSGVLVRDCSTFTGMEADYIRVAVKTRSENLLLLQALEAADRELAGGDGKSERTTK